MLKIKSRKLNMDAVLKVSLLLGFATFFFITIKSGTIHMYVHPRIILYIKIGIIVMLAMTLFQLKEIFKPQRKQVKLYQYLFFIIPLI
jgi:putative membrane protein